jgi:hypothetical protein
LQEFAGLPMSDRYAMSLKKIEDTGFQLINCGIIELAEPRPRGPIDFAKGGWLDGIGGTVAGARSPSFPASGRAGLIVQRIPPCSTAQAKPLGDRAGRFLDRYQA